jgi:Tol biopolymer transport system component
MKFIAVGMWILMAVVSFPYSAETCLSDTMCLIFPSSKQDIPQAPRISPDGKKILYEWYSKNKCEIWICDVEGKNGSPLTAEFQKSGKIDAKVENAFWHPSGGFIAFNGVPQGIQKTGYVYLAQIDGPALGRIISLEKGARPQFSKPNGNVIFFEHTGENDSPRRKGTYVNTLYYRVLGKNPLQPTDNASIPLRGPIQTISNSTELSHPSLAPNGTTILFAARASTQALTYFNITDINRQRAVELWKKFVATRIPLQKIKAEAGSILGNHLYDLDTLSTPYLMEGNEKSLRERIDSVGAQSTIIQGFTKKDFVNCWLLGLLGKLESNETEIQSLLYSKIWMTDVFGAPIVPLVDDSVGVPLPQKWATVSRSGHFSIFEAGEYRNRHLYLVNMRTRKVVKLTELGKYNSSPEISPDEQWVYFESDRNGSKCIWRARLNHEVIQSRVQGYE